MVRSISLIVLSLLSLLGVFYSSDTFASITYIPAPSITLSGSNSQVFFDVEDDIYNAGASTFSPRLSTITKTFSGAFYLSGAGWVDLGAS